MNLASQTLTKFCLGLSLSEAACGKNLVGSKAVDIDEVVSAAQSDMRFAALHAALLQAAKKPTAPSLQALLTSYKVGVALTLSH